MLLRQPLVIHSAHATHLIHDYLQTHPVEIETIKQTQDDTVTELGQLQQLSQQQLAEKVVSHEPRTASLPVIYPVHSTQLTWGRVQSRQFQASLPQPIFIVGDDVHSKRWLNQYKKRLAQLHAKGFVVNVASQTAMQALQQQFPQLSLMPMPSDVLAKWLRLAHYPVLISDKLIEQ